LSVTGHNIANVNTDSYSRQTVITGTRAPLFNGTGYFVQGAQVMNVERSYDEFINQEIRAAVSNQGQSEAFFDFSERVSNLLANTETGVPAAMNEFFDAMSVVASDPASITNREVLLAQGRILAGRFNALYEDLTAQRNTINIDIEDTTKRITAIGQNIAKVNGQIRASSSGGGQPNDLLDQKDSLLKELASLVNVFVVGRGDGSSDIFIGNGQPLVVGPNAETITSAPSTTDLEKMEVVIESGSSQVVISDSISGGRLGGLLDFRKQILTDQLNSIGRLAMSVADSINQQHQKGIDISAELGGLFFTDINATAFMQERQVASTQNSGTADISGVQVDDTNLIQDSDYTLSFDLATDTYRLTRLSDNTVTDTFTETSLGAAPATYKSATEGFTINFSAIGADNLDTWKIRPTTGGAKNIAMALSDPNKFAAASPLKVSKDAGNVGNGEIHVPTISDITNAAFTTTVKALVPELAVQFTSDTGFDLVAKQPSSTATLQGTANPTKNFTQPLRVTVTNVTAGSPGTVDFTVETVDTSSTPPTYTNIATVAGESLDSNIFSTDPALSGLGYDVNLSGTPVAGDVFVVGVTYTPDVENDIMALSGQDYGYDFKITGQPLTGDSFTLEYNTNGVSDNRNGLAISDLQQEKLVGSGSSTFSDAYGRIVTAVGTLTSEAKINAESTESLKRQMLARRDNESGVSLDEEAANLIKYQMAYQASARVVSSVQQVFDALLQIR